MAKGAYKVENSERFLLSIIKHSDLKQVDYAAVGAEHGITSHSAYCRFNGIKNKLKAALEAEGGGETKTPVTPKRGQKRASPGSAKALNAKMEQDDEEDIQTSVKAVNDGEIAELEAPESPTKRVRVKREAVKQKAVKRESGVKAQNGVDNDDSDYYE
ncbi:hypothetical protein TWF696_009308 [Orbilia brochopaga]|uniref:Myb-like DNA-binding domain-containing protein n=1 Tax=Orbilia brochopaga TaxID=3140254 RepID=A0AAV9UFN9_9PEZI